MSLRSADDLKPEDGAWRMAEWGSVQTRWLDDYTAQARAEWDNVGVAVAVVVGSDVVYARGFGQRQSGEAAAVDADTLFQVGSTTKAFTACALAMLADEGKLRWDDPAVRYVPQLRLASPSLTRDLTVRDTVIHSSGIGDNNYYPFLAVVDSDEAVAQLQDIEPEAPFRDSFRYNNLMYAVAGKIVEAASGLSWASFIERHLLTPLAMARSKASPYSYWKAEHVAPTFFGSAPAGRVGIRDALEANLAMPHGWDEHGQITVLPWRNYDYAGAAGAIVSSAADMAHWLTLNLNDGRFKDRQILREQTCKQLHRTQNPHIDASHFPFQETTESYAFGWRRTTYCGTNYLGHGGGIIGFPSYVAILPDKKVGAVVLSNGSRAARENVGADKLALHKVIALGIFDQVLGCHGSRDWNEEFRVRVSEAHRQIDRRERELQQSRGLQAPPSLALHRYAGTYVERRRNTMCVEVIARENALELVFPGRGAYVGTIEHWHLDVFRLRSSVGVAEVIDPQFVTFTVDPSGAIASMSAFGLNFRPHR
jgi:CubicO group peptidase (beta-lactamase class C family)